MHLHASGPVERLLSIDNAFGASLTDNEPTARR
jgi:hypothetical protein